MNDEHRANLRRVADALGVEAKFDMNEWINEAEDGCGTAACIGGTTELLFKPADTHWQSIGKLLGLKGSAASALFFPQIGGWPSAYRPTGASPYKATAAQAAALLRDIADGKVVFDEDARRFVMAEAS